MQDIPSIALDCLNSPPGPNAAACLTSNADRAFSATAVTPGESISVLVVEDEAMIAMLLQDVLEEMGFTVCAVEATEAGAVAAAARCRPHLMIVDARLRQGSGIAAVTTILHTRFVPHVFVSGDRLTHEALHPRAIVLQKPFLEPELARAIERALSAGAI